MDIRRSPGSQTSFHKGSEVGMSLGCLRKRKKVHVDGVKTARKAKARDVKEIAGTRPHGACRPGGEVSFVLRMMGRHWDIKRFPFLKVPTSYAEHIV